MNEPTFTCGIPIYDKRKHQLRTCGHPAYRVLTIGGDTLLAFCGRHGDRIRSAIDRANGVETLGR